MYNFLRPYDFRDDFFESFDRYFPARDRVNEDKKEYTISFSIPGFDKKDIELFVEDGMLKLVAENEDRKYSRSYSLPDVSDEDISAKLENGILTVSIPKKEVVKKMIKIS